VRLAPGPHHLPWSEPSLERRALADHHLADLERVSIDSFSLRASTGGPDRRQPGRSRQGRVQAAPGRRPQWTADLGLGVLRTLSSGAADPLRSSRDAEDDAGTPRLPCTRRVPTPRRPLSGKAKGLVGDQALGGGGETRTPLWAPSRLASLSSSDSQIRPLTCPAPLSYRLPPPSSRARYFYRLRALSAP
jgi:hypothetical protein